MLDELRHITSTEPYISSGGMRVKEILITPWSSPDAKFIFELWTNESEDKSPELWEVTCTDLAQTDGIPQAIIARTQLRLFDNHPVLWKFDDEIFFSITSKSNNISALMGDLFIEHTKACGNWVDFGGLYSCLPQTLDTLRKNQLAIPVQLEKACFKVLKEYGVEYCVNEKQLNEKKYHLLFFSNPGIWPDEENFEQAHIIARAFSERRLY